MTLKKWVMTQNHGVMDPCLRVMELQVVCFRFGSNLDIDPCSNIARNKSFTSACSFCWASLKDSFLLFCFDTTPDSKHYGTQFSFSLCRMGSPITLTKLKQGDSSACFLLSCLTGC